MNISWLCFFLFFLFDQVTNSHFQKTNHIHTHTHMLLPSFLWWRAVIFQEAKNFEFQTQIQGCLTQREQYTLVHREKSHGFCILISILGWSFGPSTSCYRIVAFSVREPDWPLLFTVTQSGRLLMLRPIDMIFFDFNSCIEVIGPMIACELKWCQSEKSSIEEIQRCCCQS